MSSAFGIDSKQVILSQRFTALFLLMVVSSFCASSAESQTEGNKPLIQPDTLASFRQGVFPEPVRDFHGFELLKSIEPNWEFDGNSTKIPKSLIRSLPYRSIEEIIALQNGVVEMRDRFDQISSTETELHVRGGRDYENGFYLNGVNVIDPITGIYTASFSTSALSSIEFYSGGFPVQFGNANSSIIDLNTISGGEKLSGFAEALTDNSIGSDFGKSHYLLSLDGPIIKSKHLTFFSLVERTKFDDRYPSPITPDALPGSPNRLPNNGLESWAYHGKMNYDPSDRISLSAHIDGSNSQWIEYLHSYYFDSAHTPYHYDDNLAIGASFSHALIPSKTSYSVGVSFFRSKRFQGDGVYKEDLWAYGRPNGNPRAERTNLFYLSDNPATPVMTDTIRVDGQLHTFVVGGDESHVYDDYLRHQAEVVTINGDITNRFNNWYSASLGVDYKKSSIRYYQHLYPVNVWNGTQGNGFQDAINYGFDDFGNEADGQSWQNETKHPVNWSAYLENKFKLDIVEINPSIRFDRWDTDALKLRNLGLPLDPDSLAFDGNPNNDSLTQTLELGDMGKVSSILKWSPRLTIKVPIKDQTIIHSSFGVHYQMPPYEYLYNDYEFFDYKIRTGGYYIPLGNSSLQPEKTILLEAGISHKFNPNIQVSVTGFRKWARDQIQVFTQPSLPRSFSTFRNWDEVDVKGIELQLELKRGKYAIFEFLYSFTDATGTDSYPNSQYNIAWVNTKVPTDIPPLDYDQRHKLVGIIDLDFRNRDELEHGPTFLEKVHFIVLLKYGSSLPYTPIAVTNEATLGLFAPLATGNRNSQRIPDELTIDLHLERSISFGKFEVTPFFEAINILDKKNVANVWQGTGLPNSTGWLQTSDGQQFIQASNTPDYTGLNGEQKYYIKQQLPQHYFAPRQYFFGLRAAF